MAENSDEIERLIDKWFKDELKAAYKPLGTGTFASALAEPDATAEARARLNRDMFGSEADSRLEQLITDIKNQDYSAARPIVNHLMAQLSEPLGPDDREYAIACQIVMDALAAIQSARFRWAEGDERYTPSWKAADARHTPIIPSATEDFDLLPPQAAIDSSKPNICTITGPKLGETISKYIELIRRGKTRQTEKLLGQTEGELNLLISAFGFDAEVSKITIEDGGKVFEGLQSLPPRFKANPNLNGLPFFEMVEKAQQMKDHTSLDPKTTNGYMSTFKKFFDAQKKAGKILNNPFDGMRVKLDRIREEGREFTSEELAAIFCSPLFQGSKSLALPYNPGNFLIRTWNFWATMIAFYTGARVSEVAQLRVCDVKEKDSVWVLDFNEEDRRRLKNGPSARQVPLHPELHRLGLLELRETQIRRGLTSLLPNCPNPIRGDPGKQLSRWMSEKFLPRVLGTKRPGLGFHSFRHGMATMLRDAAVPEGTADKILGHKTPGQGRSYGTYSNALKLEGLNKITIPDTLRMIPSRKES